MVEGSGWWERAKGWVRERGGARETDRGERGAWKRKRDEWKGKWILVGSQITRGTIDRNICRSVGVTHTAYIETRLYIEHRPCAERGERSAHTYLPTYIHTYIYMYECLHKRVCLLRLFANDGTRVLFMNAYTGWRDLTASPLFKES